MATARTALLWTLMVSVVGGLFAQELVDHLQDLIGARGRSGETQLQERGYTWVRTEKSENVSYGFWQDTRSERCVRVGTSEGRYSSIVYTSDVDCQSSEEGDERQDEFQTVCGVAFEGKIHRHLCKAVDFYRGDKKWRTELYFPDQVMRLRWQNDRTVAVHVEGLETRRAEYRTAEGDTNFFLEDKTYFYTSDKEAAALEVANF